MKPLDKETSRLLKKGLECFDKLGMHGFVSTISAFFPLVLSQSKDSE
jgi:hypothetical protein